MQYRSAVAQAAAVKRREVSRVELIRAHLPAIERLNPQLNAFTDLCVRSALRDAKAADKARREALSPLDGAVTAVKDLNMMRGSFTRLGTLAARYLIAPTDDLVVHRLRRAGLSLLGKLATSELGTMPLTEPRLHPPTMNPYLPGHNAGGSSGGSGAAVGAGLLQLAHGNDGAGSIRIPAAFCGVFGLKPTHSLVPNPIPAVDTNALTANGGLASTVEDVAAITDALANLHGNAALLPRLDALPKTKLRVRVSYESELGPTHPQIRAAVARVARWFEEQGHTVDERPWLEGGVAEFLPIWQRQAADIPIPTDLGMMPVARWLRSHGRLITHEQAKRAKQELEARVDHWFDGCDVWLSPTVPQFAPKNGSVAGMDGASAFFAVAPFGGFTAPFNLSGQPSGTVPVGYGDGGEPIGAQITAPRGHDLLVLQLMRALEQDFAAARAARRPAIA